MALPVFSSLASRRRNNEKIAPLPVDAANGNTTGVIKPDEGSDRTLTPNAIPGATYTPGVDIKRATKTRKIWIIISSLLFLISVVFLILTIIGNTSNKAVIRDTYFYTLDLTNIIPATADDIVFVNSLARSLGLHDFYQVGLWSFCEGYNNEGITYCSTPKSLYYFNPVEILVNELFSGATIALPAEITNILSLIRIASHIMFGFFLAGICMNFISIFIVFLGLSSRWWSFALAIWTFIAALLTVAGTIIGTVMALIFQKVATSQDALNIGASYGVQMFAFTWTAAGASLIGFVIHLCMTCCCASRRDVRTGRRKGSKKAYGDAERDEKKRVIGGRRFVMPGFRRRATAGEVV